MKITVRKLQTTEERFRAERLIATSFLHNWDEKEARENAENPGGDVWGAFDEGERLVSAVTTLGREMTYEGRVISAGELHMVGTLPEARGGGAVHHLMNAILREYRDRGDLFAILIPFSFAFYRKYGFEAASDMLIQKAEIGLFAPFRQELSARQILSQRDADEAKGLYADFIRNYNFADLKKEEDWTYHGEGEFGRRDWMNGDKTHYSYLFRDESGKARAYFTFVFAHGPEGPFVGTMEITELIFDSPEALRSVFGFIYGMRAKITHVRTEMPVDVDWSIMLPERDGVERRLDGHMMARALNIDGILQALRPPEGSGQYSIRVEDSFLPENTGTRTVRFAEGKVTHVAQEDVPADLEVTVETFCQLSAGLIDLKAALYRMGTKLNSSQRLLEQIFVKKPLLLR